MSRKYIRQVQNHSFVYPNNGLSEYDIEIVHDLKDKSVAGSASNFVAVFSGNNISVSFDYVWVENGAEPFINQDGKLSVLSVHMMDANNLYYKPWRLIGEVRSPNVNDVIISGNFSTVVTPSQLGVSGFTNGIYYFEIRLIGHRAILPICVTSSVVYPSPTPTPSATAGGPYATPTVTPTPSVTPGLSPSPTPTHTVTPSPSPMISTYLAACSGGIILGWIPGEYTANLQVTIGGNCYVTTYTTTNPSIGSLITGDKTWGTCCPAPTPTPLPPPVGVGIYSGSTFSTSSGACADTHYPNGTVYIANGDTLSNGDTVYIDTLLTVPFVGNSNYYRIYTSGHFVAATIGSGGYVNNLTVC